MLSDLNIIFDWLKFNKLSLNISKSSFMFISKQNIIANKDAIILNGREIKYSNSIRFLGPYIDENLTWKIHISKIKEKTIQYVGILSKVRYYLPLKYLKLIFFCFIYSRFEYIASIWATACNYQLY